MIKIAIIIWFLLISCKIYDYTQNSEHKSGKAIQEEIINENPNSRQKANFDPEWEGYKIERNTDKIVKIKDQK